MNPLISLQNGQEVGKERSDKVVCFYFQVHQPYRLRESSFFEGEEVEDYFVGPKGARNREVFEKVAKKCYLPATQMILDLLKRYPEMRVSYSLSGVFLEQCEEYGEVGREVLDLFRRVVQTGQAEILAETYYHSLAFLFSKEEFAEQVNLHAEKVKSLFGVWPRVFRNTELIYGNEVAEFARQMGFEAILAEGWDPYLKGGSPNFLHRAERVELHPEDSRIAREYALNEVGRDEMAVLLKNYKLSDDIAFRFSQRAWQEHPLFTEKFAHWVGATEGQTVNLFMDYETLGEHQWEDTGIFDFFQALPEELLKRGIGFETPSEVVEGRDLVGHYDVPGYISWADTDRDLSAWLENEIQQDALREMIEFERMIHPHKRSEHPDLRKILDSFRKLQTSDHLYYMCTKYFADGDVHKYFSPYESEHAPYDAYIYFMNVVRKMRARLEEVIGEIEEEVEGELGFRSV